MSASSSVLASFNEVDATVSAIEGLKAAGFKRLTAYAPFPEHHIEAAMGYKESPVRVFTLVGGLTGAATGFGFTMFSQMDWPMVTGGKPIFSIPAYVVIAFELTILFGALSTLIGLFLLMKLPRFKPPVVYDPELSSGRFGVLVEAPADKIGEARRILEQAHPAALEGGQSRS